MVLDMSFPLSFNLGLARKCDATSNLALLVT